MICLPCGSRGRKSKYVLPDLNAEVKFIPLKNLHKESLQDNFVEFWGLLPLVLFFNTSTGWFGRFVLSTECYRTRKLDYNDLNSPRCSGQVTESLALTDGGFCQKQTLYILDYAKIVSLWCVF